MEIPSPGSSRQSFMSTYSRQGSLYDQTPLIGKKDQEKLRYYVKKTATNEIKIWHSVEKVTNPKKLHPEANFLNLRHPNFTPEWKIIQCVFLQKMSVLSLPQAKVSTTTATDGQCRKSSAWPRPPVWARARRRAPPRRHPPRSETARRAAQVPASEPPSVATGPSRAATAAAEWEKISFFLVKQQQTDVNFWLNHCDYEELFIFPWIDVDATRRSSRLFQEMKCNFYLCFSARSMNWTVYFVLCQMKPDFLYKTTFTRLPDNNSK
jgi:hypothetical protein